jgi:hypothetical protein
VETPLLLSSAGAALTLLNWCTVLVLGQRYAGCSPPLPVIGLALALVLVLVLELSLALAFVLELGLALEIGVDKGAQPPPAHHPSPPCQPHPANGIHNYVKRCHASDQIACLTGAAVLTGAAFNSATTLEAGWM